MADNPIGWLAIPYMTWRWSHHPWSTLGWTSEVPWFDNDEVCRVGTVGVDAADHGCSGDHELGLLDDKEGVRVSLVGQIELGVGAQDKVGEA